MRLSFHSTETVVSNILIIIAFSISAIESVKSSISETRRL